MTKQLKYFTAFAAVWGALFFAILELGLHRSQATSSAYMSLFIVFVVVLSSVQKFFAGRDSQRDVRINLPVRYAAVSAAVSLIVSCGWLLAWHQNIWLVVLAAVASVGIVSLMAATMSRKTIKGSKKEDLFK